MAIGVVADESPTGWLVEVGRAPAVVTVAPRDEVADRGDVRLEGPAVAVYLTLWNRSDELTSTTAPRPLEVRSRHVGVTVRSRSGRDGKIAGTRVGKVPSHRHDDTTAVRLDPDRAGDRARPDRVRG